MGGFVGCGNCILNVEFNIVVDLEVVVCVFCSGIEIVMCGLDVINQVILIFDYFVILLELNCIGKMFYVLFSYYCSGSM